MKRVAIGLVLALCCAGCGYHKMPKFEHLKRATASVVKREKGVEVRARVVNKKELRTLLGGLSLSERAPYTCVHVTIKNAATVPAFLDVKHLSGVVLVDEVAAKGFGCTYKSCNDMGRRTAYCTFGLPAAVIPSMFLGSLATVILIFGFDSPYASPAKVFALWGLTVAAALAIGIGLVTLLVRNEPVACSRALMLGLRERVLDELFVKPGKMESTLIFVRQDRGCKELVLPIAQFPDERVLFTANVPLNIAQAQA